MTTKVTAVENNGGKPLSKPPRLPPEERFWKRYSPHHEFPLSLSSSLFLHIIVLAVLLLGGGFLLWLGLRQEDTPLPVDAVVIGGSGGNPQGVGDSRGDGIIPSGPEAIEKDRSPEVPLRPPSGEPLRDPDDKLSQISEVLDRPNGKRLIEEEVPLTDSRLDEILKKLSKETTQGIVAGRGQGGTGQGGRQGRGDGSGTGDREGAGQGLTQRQKRQMRWTITFGRIQGDEYARRLAALGAVLAVPGSDGKYVIIRDLTERPARPQREDLSQFKGMLWKDTRPESVRSLALALGLPVPEYFAAFFPVSLEKDLLDKEMNYFHARHLNGKEDEIEETVFELVLHGGQYDTVVASQSIHR